MVRPVRSLTRKHVDPNNLERQKVKYAMDIFRSEVIASIKTLAENKKPGFEHVTAIVEFMEVFSKWIAIHDISSTKEHITQRLAVKMPFYSSDDERLTWLTTDESWKAGTRKRSPFFALRPTKMKRKKLNSGA